MTHDPLTQDGPTQKWWTTDALAASELPDVPGTRRGVDALARRQGWRADPMQSRKRTGRGGGWEYHWKLLPARAQAALLKADSLTPAAVVRLDRGEAWAYFDGLPDRVKKKAYDRLATVQNIDSLTIPLGRQAAVAHVAQSEDVGQRTLWNWLALIDGVDVADWLAYLAPRHRATKPKRARATCSPEFLDWLRADYLRLGEPSFSACYDRAVALCKARSLRYLTSRTARRWIDENIPRVTQVLARQGVRGLEKCFPPQIRDRSGMTAMEGVNADCHKIDIFVAWPGIDKPVRPQIVAFQDLYSGKILSWQVDLDPNKVAVMSAFGEMIETWGIPKHCLFDNGREFANKWLSGGVPSRFRFKVRKDDALGVLPQMGIRIHWAKPGHGQAKPIERAFRDIADRVALDPRFAGAYVGHKPDAKPEDYGSRAIPLDDFLRVLDQGVRDHNARPGRLSDTAKGRSFDETFAESYAQAPIRKATPEQQRLWLMGQEVRKLHRTHGQLTLYKNGYWADWMNEYAGQTVALRFDPENLHAGLYVYALDGVFLGQAECRQKTGFFNLVGAKDHARLQRQRKAAEKALLKTMRPVSVDDLAAEMDAVQSPAPTPTPLVEAKVVEITPARARKPLIERQVPIPETGADDRLTVFQADFSKPKSKHSTPAETAADRFWRALDIEQRSEAGEPISQDDADFLTRMQRLPEYRAQRIAYAHHGAQAIG